jgi:Domain of unknown function (DUF3883)
MLTPQQLIQQIQGYRAQSSHNTETLACVLSLLKADLGGENKFISEILQNADDAATQPTLSLKIIIIDDYLIIFHNGGSFNEGDVIKICNAADPNNEKRSNTNKIGYKGIGFKSVFGISHCVYVNSGGYSFRFDENYWEGQKLPWPLIPIWTDVNDKIFPKNIWDSLFSLQENSTTCFVLKLERKRNVLENLAQLENNLKILLFLRCAVTLEIYEQNNKEPRMRSRMSCLRSEDGQFYQLHCEHNNVREIEGWLVFSALHEIPADVKRNLEEDIPEAPERLFKNHEVKITLAARFDNVDGKRELCQPSPGPLFCYLPTQVKCPFPVLVNADFLLKTSRTDLIDGKRWNAFLFEKTMVTLFRFLKALTMSDYREQVLILFPMPKLDNILSLSIKKAYEDSWQWCTKNIDFLPGQRLKDAKDAQLTLNEAWLVDDAFKTLISESSRKLEILKLPTFHNINPLISNLRSTNVIEPYLRGRISSDNQWVINWLKLPYVISYFEQGKLFNFLKETIINENKAQLKQVRFIKVGNEFVKPEDAMISDEDSMDDTPGQVSLNFRLIEKTSYDGKGLKDWLLTLGVKLLTRQDTLAQAIGTALKLKRGDWDGTLAFLQYFYNNRNKLSELQLHKLHSLQLYCAAHENEEITRFANAIYLPNRLNPKLQLEGRVEEKVFLHPGYLSRCIQNPSQENIDNFREFLLAIGIRDTVTVRRIPEVKLSELPNYIAELDKEYYLEYQRNYKIGSNDVLINFVYVDFMNYLLKDEKYLTFFLDAIKNNWDQLKFLKTNYRQGNFDLSRATYLNTGFPLNETFVQFFFKAVPVKMLGYNVKIQDLLLLSEEDEKLSMMKILPYRLNSEDIKKLSLQQREWLGFRTKLNLEECIKLLEHLANSVNETQTSPSFYENYVYLFKRLIQLSNDHNINILEAIQKKPINLLLPAENSTLVSYTQLYGLGLSRQTCYPSAYWLKKLPELSTTEYEKLCRLFGIKLIKDADIKPVMIEPYQTEVVKTYIHDRLIFILYEERKDSTEHVNDLYTTIMSKFSELSFQFCKSLKLTFQGNTYLQEAYSYQKGNIIFFKNSTGFQNALTINFLCEILSAKLSLKERSRKLLPILMSISSMPQLVQELQDIGYYFRDIILFYNQLLESEGYISKSLDDYFHSQQAVASTNYAAPPVTQPLTDQRIINVPSSFSLLETLDMSRIPFKWNTPNKPNGSDVPRVVPSDRNIEQDGLNLQEEEKPNMPEIGHWGESLVFSWLCWFYKSKYPPADYEYRENKKEGQFIVYKKQTRFKHLFIHWYNANGESHNHHDLEVQKYNNGECIKTRPLEVKSTKSDNPALFYVSNTQDKEMRDNKIRNQYRLFRVYGSTTPSPRIMMIKDPVRLIDSNIIPRQTIGYKL